MIVVVADPRLTFGGGGNVWPIVGSGVVPPPLEDMVGGGVADGAGED